MAKNTRIAFFFACDIVCFNVSYLLAYFINASFGAAAFSPGEALENYFAAYPAGFLILMIVKMLAMYVFSVYKIMFEYAGIRDFQRIALSLTASTLASVTAAALIGIGPALSPFVILFSFVFDMAFALVVRILYVRQVVLRREETDSENASFRRRYTMQKKKANRVLIIGVNRAAADLIAEMQENERLPRKPEIIIDDDKTHDGDTLLGVEVVAGRNEIRLRSRRQSIDEIIIAKPGASKRQIAALLRECVKTRCQISMLPLSQANETSAAMLPVTLADLRRPTVADLFGRDRPHAPHREIGEHLRGRVVLVTGGAGTLGAELCRQIIRYRPRRLIALDIDEDGLTMLAAELEKYHTGETEFRTVIASVRDVAMMHRAFGAFRPHIVFHAAELKQIPFAQTNPREAFLTNVLSLKTACDLADEYAAEKFVLCSTIRAANPVNVASECKRTAELYIIEKNEKSRTTYTSVRLPNLIEGRGNVIAIFRDQIEKGGPLTVTDKDIARRFISVEEAALLTIRAAAFAQGGETWEIGPGEVLGIRELAEAMIRLAGKIPYEDIDIVITQLRPGERLFDDVNDEKLRAAAQSGEQLRIVDDNIGGRLPHWSQLWCQDPARMDDAAVMELLRLIFPTYKTKRTTTAGNTMRGERIENE